MSRSASITSCLTERSLKKAVCEAFLWIPLISFARVGNTVCWHHSWQGASVPCCRSRMAQSGIGGQAVSLPHSSTDCARPADIPSIQHLDKFILTLAKRLYQLSVAKPILYQ